MKKTIHQAALVVTVLAFIFSFPQFAFAVGSSGFENASYSARSLGQSNAVVARPEEPSTIVFNPAGIPELKGVQFQMDLAGLTTHTWYKNPSTGDIEMNTPQLVLIPTGFATANLGEAFDNRLGVGIGMTYPFGLNNRYESHGVARYVGHNNRIKILGLTMAAGYQVTDKFNVGGGAVYYNMYQYDQVLNYPNSFILSTPGLADGRAKTYFSGKGWGWIASSLYKITKKHQVGVFYRSKANVKAHGRVKIEDLQFGQLQGFSTTPYWESAGKTDVNLPSNLTIGYAYIPSDKWAWELDLGWTHWSVFSDQNFEWDDANTVINSLGTISRNYHNTLSLNTGGHYRLNDKFDLLAGMFMYSAASPEDHFDAVIPDAARIAGTFGFTYNITKKLDFSATYLSLFFLERSIHNQAIIDKSGTSIDGKYSTFIHGFMTGFTYRFGDQTDGVLKPSNGHVEPL
ncbi:MAG: hypothetical protein COW12_06055 [Candidatus Omnitrophica bacterium CG12_big_fil_rev_8_21_14_0_65_45_16]|nr:MAG: hypothetical protein COW12_06055 [Candidatus Omnitrophica bacterium CG12_big_fil_rev_8_21_14_0_65_45_16]